MDIVDSRMWGADILWWHEFKFFSADTCCNLRAWGLIDWPQE